MPVFKGSSFCREILRSEAIGMPLASARGLGLATKSIYYQSYLIFNSTFSH